MKVKKILTKSQAQFWEKLRIRRLGQNDGFLILKKRAFIEYYDPNSTFFCEIINSCFATSKNTEISIT